MRYKKAKEIVEKYFKKEGIPVIFSFKIYNRKNRKDIKQWAREISNEERLRIEIFPLYHVNVLKKKSSQDR